MSIDLYSLTTDTWEQLIQRFGLKLCRLAENDLVAVGENYAILIWLDRDGLSIRYLDRTPQAGNETVDLVAYLIENRRWILIGGPLYSEDQYLMARQGLINCAHTLEAAAQDILSGRKEWLSDPAVTRLPLTPFQQEQIAQTIKKCITRQ